MKNTMRLRSLPNDFSPFCVDYTSLKNKLKEPFNDDHEREFILLFEHEMKKVFDFVGMKQSSMIKESEDLEVRSKASEENVGRLVEKMKNDLRFFVEYVRINVYLLDRVLKKHDKNTRYLIRAMYRSRLKVIANDEKVFDNLFYRISKISLSLTGNEIVNTESSFIRKTSKYWVPKKNVNAIKSMVISHLPIYVHQSAVDFESMHSSGSSRDSSINFSNRSENEATNNPANSSSMSSSVYSHINRITSNNRGQNFGNSRRSNTVTSTEGMNSPYHAWDNRFHDTCVSSVYLDNTNFDLYKSRLHKNQGAEAIRIRWYTSKDQKIVFIERKKHQESWTGEKSAKLRFNIPEKCVNDYLLGRNVWKEVERVNNADVESTFVLYTEIQGAIMSKNLRPVLRTFYKRSAFQLPNDPRVRISLDTNLCMIKESTEVFTNWRRLDVGCNYPFEFLGSREIVRFPHAILEVKIQGDTQPMWVDDIVSGYYVEAVDKFSKFMHGCAVLFPQINDIPYWLPQCHIDINKDPVSELNELNSMIDQTPLSVASSRIEVIDVEDKRITVPIRVEPKVFFANERTFLSWLHYSIFIGTFGTAMVGLGSDRRALYCGVIFIITSVIFAIYALYLYLWRAGMIRKKSPGPYDDLYGPIALTLIFLFAMLLSLYFKLEVK